MRGRGWVCPEHVQCAVWQLGEKIAYAIDESPQYYLVNYFCRFPQEKPELVVTLRPSFVTALECLHSRALIRVVLAYDGWH